MTFKKLSLIALSAALILSTFTGCSAKAAEVSPEEQTPVVDVSVEKTATAYDEYFVTAQWLNENRTQEGMVILDARGDKAYGKGHIPNAIPVTWQSLSNVGVEFASKGWGTVLDAEALSTALSNLGIEKDSQIIVYADTQNGWGEDGRILWTLNAAGLESVYMLDGGYNIWSSLGFETTKDSIEITPSDIAVTELDLSKSIATKELVSNFTEYKTIDTRDFDEYEGAQKFGEARGGHLPNTIWISYKSLLNEDGTLKDLASLDQIFTDAGLEKDDYIATYCTAGIRSAHFAVVLDMLGFENAVNYDESFYVWANKPELKLGKVVKEKAYNYYTANHLKTAINNNDAVTVLDIQVADEYNAHHIKGAIETNAYPVKSDEDKAKLDVQLENLKSLSNPIVIVCPRGGGGAERTYQYLEEKGVEPANLYILEGGQKDWPHAELLEK